MSETMLTLPPATAAGLLALLLAPAVDRWVERFDEWVDRRLKGAFNASGRHLHHPRLMARIRWDRSICQGSPQFCA